MDAVAYAVVAVVITADSDEDDFVSLCSNEPPANNHIQMKLLSRMYWKNMCVVINLLIFSFKTFFFLLHQTMLLFSLSLVFIDAG